MWEAAKSLVGGVNDSDVCLLLSGELIPLAVYDTDGGAWFVGTSLDVCAHLAGVAEGEDNIFAVDIMTDVAHACAEFDDLFAAEGVVGDSEVGVGVDNEDIVALAAGDCGDVFAVSARCSFNGVSSLAADNLLRDTGSKFGVDLKGLAASGGVDVFCVGGENLAGVGVGSVVFSAAADLEGLLTYKSARSVNDCNELIFAVDEGVLCSAGGSKGDVLAAELY